MTHSDDVMIECSLENRWSTVHVMNVIAAGGNSH